ncbi:MAG: phosphatidylglycerol lysyltransferase domain-containing protein [Treponemataceae bacterium]|nr:phosphatidylglycerol lysyltransferase domain-containing protein [Treponemataceae bacterium]
MKINLDWHSPTVDEISSLQNQIITDDLFSNDSSLASLYFLKDKYDIQIAVKNDVLYRYFEGKKSRTGYLFPIFLKSNSNYDYTQRLRKAIDEIRCDARSNSRRFQFCLVSQKQKNDLDSIISVDWNTDRNDSDYLYFSQELAELNGKDFHKKKNHLTHFISEYGKSFKAVELETEDDWQDALTVAYDWMDQNSDDDDEDLEKELESIREAIENYSELNLKGMVIYIDDEPVAMTIASKISDQVLDVNFEKALSPFTDNGLYTAICSMFAKSQSEFLYLNREEDMGIEGLRKSKLSYRPSIILDKYFGPVC